MMSSPDRLRRRTRKYPKHTTILPLSLLFSIGFSVLVTQRLSTDLFGPEVMVTHLFGLTNLSGSEAMATNQFGSTNLSGSEVIATDLFDPSWPEFEMDYKERFGRLPPETMKAWLRYANSKECNERDFYNGIEEDLRSFRNQVNQTGLFSYTDVVRSGLKQTDNYIAFQVDNHDIRTVASRNYHMSFVQQSEIEKNLRWILEPLRKHKPPLRTLIFFDLHDHPTKFSTPQSLPMFTTNKMSYLTDNQPIPTDQELSRFLKRASGNRTRIIHAPFHPNYTDSYDCRSILVPYYFGREAPLPPADPSMPAWESRNDSIVWRGSTTGYDWGKSPRFQLMDKFGGGGDHPHPMPRGANPISPGVPVDADFGFFQVVQNYTSNYTMAPNWRMAPFMKPIENQMYKYIMDVDGNAFTSRFSAILRAGSVVFKSTRFREWFSERLLPFVDYIPVNYNLSDLAEKVEWIHNRPEVASAIAQHGKATSMHHIRDEDMRCYTYRLMLEYSTLFQPDWII